MMKIDLHVHTRERSVCATMTEDEQIRAAIQAGIDGIAITEHDQLVPAAHLAELRAKFAPFRIFTGIEVQAEDHHWVVIGLHDPALERLDWRYPELREYVRQRGGFMILAHPFRYKPEVTVDLDGYPPDGVEVKSVNTPKAREADIRALAARLGLALFCNSDAHHRGTIGSYHTTLPGTVEDDRQLLEALFALKTAPAAVTC